MENERQTEVLHFNIIPVLPQFKFKKNKKTGIYVQILKTYLNYPEQQQQNPKHRALHHGQQMTRQGVSINKRVS